MQKILQNNLPIFPVQSLHTQAVGDVLIWSDMVVRYVSILAVALVFLTIGCGYHESVQVNMDYEEIQIKSEEIVKMKRSVQLIMEAGNIDQDSAEGTVETLLDLGASSLENVELISNTRGIVLCAIDEDGNTYYLGFGGLGYLEVIRKDSEDGEIIYALEE